MPYVIRCNEYTDNDARAFVSTHTVETDSTFTAITVWTMFVADRRFCDVQVVDNYGDTPVWCLPILEETA